MIIAANAYLGRIYDDSPIGYQPLTLNRNGLRAWTTDNVMRTAPGWWAVAGGVEIPNAGGFIAWGLEGGPALAEAAIDPAPDTSAIMLQVTAAIASLLERIRAMLPAPPPLIVETAHFDAGVQSVAESIAESDRQALERLTEVAAALSAIRAMTDNLSVLSDGANQVMALAEMRNRLNGILGEPPAGLAAVTELRVEPLVSAIDGLRGDMGRFVDRVEVSRQSDERRLKSVQALDKFLHAVEGQEGTREPGHV